MELDEKFMREALAEARAAAAEEEIPIGAVIVCNGRIIGKGHNMVERLHDATAHAEMIAITAATEALGGKYLQDCTLYVTVEPCPMCAAALNWSQISRMATASTPLPCFIPAQKSFPACWQKNAEAWSATTSRPKDSLY